MWLVLSRGSFADMEMVEDEKTQPQITSKRFKLLKEEEEDRISLLPDCLLILILSLLDSTKYAIRTGTLSKRWQHLWPQVSNLSFYFYGKDQLLSNFCSFVDKTLTRCLPLNLNKFTLSTTHLIEFESKVNEWILYATSRNVQDLYLSLWHPGYPRFQFDQSFFRNSCFTRFKLHCGILKPTCAISWSKLKCLSISFGILDEDLIQNILSGSPLLETLSLEYSKGLRRLDITSKSVQNLVLSSNYDLEEINARDILSLTVNQYLMNFMLLNVSSCVKVDLNYVLKERYYELTPKEELEEEVMLGGLILSLRHAKEVKLGYCCSEALARLEDKGFSCPSTVKKCLIFKMKTKTQEELLLEDGHKVFALQLHESAGGLPKTKLVSHSCSLAGSTSAIEVSIPIAFVLPDKEHECNESFKLGRSPALS
ncbi:F-box/LRR-repeat protein 25-like protein [Tanacetum coccineum]